MRRLLDRETGAEIPASVRESLLARPGRPAIVLDEVARESGGRVSLAKVNVDEHPALAARYGIRSIPTILLVKEGKVVDQVVGAVPKTQLKKKLDAIA